ncbi:MAG: hypothetical protein OEQ53_19415, partial [Saprospiraceae bacterium]|nr:hypothetical protein [Saprospiraceae bacterium]
GLASLSLGIVYLLSHSAGFRSSAPISLFSILFFSLLCLVIHYVAKSAARNPNKNLLTQLIMVVVFLKLIFCLLLVVGYDRMYQPENNNFIIPFLLFYLIYTSFEVVILTKANRLSPK